jgi:ubiquinone biosynthesis monooxygenase Coq7
LRPRSLLAALTVALIVRVNHAGEFGAIRIYSTQNAIAARLYPDVAPALADMLTHEREHCAAFRDAMPARGSRPCRVMSLWSWGGALLGLATALMGRQAIWICTAAVEAAVHRHLGDELHFLKERDTELTGVILAIRQEELSHLHHAEARITANRARRAPFASNDRGCDGCGHLALHLGRLDAHGARFARESAGRMIEATHAFLICC